MKPFDLQKALAGEPVVTRSGKPARLTHFPLNFTFDGYTAKYTLGGKHFYNNGTKDDCYDLFMKEEPKKKYIVLAQSLEGKIVVCGVCDKELDAKAIASQVDFFHVKKVQIVTMDVDDD